MKRLFQLLTALGLALALTQLTNCAGTADVPSLLSQPVDSALQRQVVHQLSLRHFKIKGNVTVQLGTGNTATDARKARRPVASGTSQAQDYSKAGQHGGALATAPGASAGATTRTGLPPWLLAVAAGVLLLLGLALLAYKLRSWFSSEKIKALL